VLDLRSAEQTLVRRLRVGASRLDPLAATLRVRSAFAALDLSPSWLAPSAILCVRSLRLTRACRLSHAGGAAQLSQSTRDALRAEIERLARVASRSAHGRVAAASESVIFADRSELFACLASDWCGRREAESWWWRSLFKRTPDRRAIVAALAASPAHLPGSLALLARRGESAKFAGALSDEESRALLRAVTRGFALGGLETALALGEDEREQEPSPEGNAASRTNVERHQSRDARRAPWFELAPEAEDRSLGVAARCLLGVSLAAARAPSLVRRAEFARRAHEWARAGFSFAGDAHTPTHAATDHSGDTRTAAHNESGGHLARARFDAGDSASRGTTSRKKSNRDVDSRGMRDDASLTNDAVRVSKARHAISEPRDEANDDDSARARLVARDGACDEQRAPSPLNANADDGAGEGRQVDSSSTPDAFARERWQALDETRIETRFGGLFFLVNLALYLDLYGDFTAPAAECLPLDVWDFVALIGRGLAGDRVESDPVWSLLARLAGRDATVEPGEEFEPADEWRAPVEWLKPFTIKGAWLWSASGGRLHVRHPASFFVIDTALSSNNTREQLAREMQPYIETFAGVRLRASRRRLIARGANARERWLGIVNGYVRARLRRALGVGGSRLARMLIERGARVFVTASHVDVVMRLAELPVEIRFAGLDRDPGFVPAAGRSVAFHFE
jgi:hypothetical protein